MSIGAEEHFPGGAEIRWTTRKGRKRLPTQAGRSRIDNQHAELGLLE